MLNAVRAWNAWVELASQAVLLGLDAQRVIALRLMRLAAGGALAKSEASQIITEKVEALGEAQTVAAISTMGGRTSRQVAKSVFGVYKKKVRGNDDGFPSKPCSRHDSSST